MRGRVVYNAALILMTIAVVVSFIRAGNARDAVCVEVEEIKKGLRAEEIERHGNLARNLRILKVKNTPEVRAIALADHQRKMALFAPGCPTHK